MELPELQRTWNELAQKDALWAILGLPDKRGERWGLEEFMSSGTGEIQSLLDHVAALGLAIGRGRALDFGAGVGRLTQALSSHFEQVDGVEIAPAMVERATKLNRHGDRCRYHLNLSNSLAMFPSNSFDLVCSYLVLQHIPAPYAVEYLAEFLRVLSPTGVLVFQLPSHPKGSIAALKHRVRGSAPHWLKSLYRRVKWGSQHVSDMYGIPQDRVLAFIQQRGGRFVDIEPDESAGKQWVSFRYWVTKQGSSGP